MQSKNKNKIVNWLLVPLFLLALWSGIELHDAGYHTHHIWHTCAVVHSISGILMAVLVVVHVVQHWKWYKALARPLKVRKARVRRYAVICLSVLMAAVVVTGLWLLLAVDGAGSHTGLVHFWLGLIASVFALRHILKRYRQLIHA